MRCNLALVCLLNVLVMTACDSDTPTESRGTPDTGQTQSDQNESTDHVVDKTDAGKRSRKIDDMLRRDFDWETGQDSDLLDMAKFAKDAAALEEFMKGEAGATMWFLSTGTVIEWYLMGPERSQPHWARKTSADLRGSFAFPRTDPMAQYTYGRKLIANGNDKEKKEGAHFVLRSARTGFSPAQAYLASLLTQKDGPLPVDRNRAILFAKAAADQGNFAGDYLLAQVHGIGGATQEEQEIGVKHARRLVDNDVSAGHLLMGFMIERGVGGLEKDYAKAREHYQAAALGGQPMAFHALSSYYYKGVGGEKSMVWARVYAMLATAKGMDRKDLIREIDKQITRKQIAQAKRDFELLRKETSTFDDKKLAVRWVKALTDVQKSYERSKKVSEIKPSERTGVVE